MKKEKELDVNLVLVALREQIGLLAIDKAILTARLEQLENTEETTN